MSNYIGFYPSRPIWAVSKIDLMDPNIESTFSALMSETVHRVETEELSIRICRDGCILIRINKLERQKDELAKQDIMPSIQTMVARWSSYLDFLNSFYLLLDSASLEIDKTGWLNLSEITTKDAFTAEYRDDEMVGCNIATESITSVFQQGRYTSNYRQNTPFSIDSRLSGRQLITANAISTACDGLIDVMKKPGSEKHLASYAKSISEYKIGNYETAIVLAWFIIESIANIFWQNYLNSINKHIDKEKLRINRKRMDNLTGAAFTANITTNLLELLDIIPHELFETMDKVRGYRNKIAHTDNYSPTTVEAEEALITAKAMISKQWNLDFTPNLIYSIIGI